MVGCCRHQEKVIKLDTVMRMMAAKTPAAELEGNPKWQRLVTLHASLKKLLPEGHRCANCTASMCARRSVPTGARFGWAGPEWGDVRRGIVAQF